jgi:hypothetical protein
MCPADCLRVVGAAGDNRDVQAGHLMLSEMLLQLLVAYTIEHDNEFEHHMPHLMSSFGPGGPGDTSSAPGEAVGSSAPGEPIRRPWLASMFNWSNFMRFVPPEGIPARRLESLSANRAGLKRWGYIRIKPADGADPGLPESEWLVRATRAGRWAQAGWRQLDGVVDRRWERRFGAGAVGDLRDPLLVIASELGPGMPLYLPMVVYSDGMRTSYRDLAGSGLPMPPVAERDLSALLSAVLLAFTVEYESLSRLPLPIGANVLRVIDDGGVRVADVPLLGGVSSEGVSSALGFLERHGYVEIGPDPSGRPGKVVRPTERGRQARDGRPRLAAKVEQGWRDRFGAGEIDRLHEALSRMLASRSDGRPTLALGLEPYPEGWRSRGRYLAQTRAVLRDPARSLPRHPMVLHRGGYPDGS